MATSSAHRLLQGSEHPQPKGFKKLQPTDGAQELTVTLMLRRHQGHTQVTPEEVIRQAIVAPHTRGLRKSTGRGAERDRRRCQFRPRGGPAGRGRRRRAPVCDRARVRRCHQ